MGKAISEAIFKIWCEKMDGQLLCYEKDRMIFLEKLQRETIEFERKNQLKLEVIRKS